MDHNELFKSTSGAKEWKGVTDRIVKMIGELSQ